MGLWLNMETVGRIHRSLGANHNKRSKQYQTNQKYGRRPYLLGDEGYRACNLLRRRGPRLEQHLPAEGRLFGIDQVGPNCGQEQRLGYWYRVECFYVGA